MAVGVSSATNMQESTPLARGDGPTGEAERWIATPAGKAVKAVRAGVCASSGESATGRHQHTLHDIASDARTYQVAAGGFGPIATLYAQGMINRSGRQEVTPDDAFNYSESCQALPPENWMMLDRGDRGQ